MKKIITLTLLPLASIAQTAQDTIIANIDTTLQIVQDVLQDVPKEWNTTTIIGFVIVVVVAGITIYKKWKKNKK